MFTSKNNSKMTFNQTTVFPNVIENNAHTTLNALLKVNDSNLFSSNSTGTMQLPVLTIVNLVNFAIGTVTNILIIVVITGSSLRKCLFMNLLVTLAIMDNLFLWSISLMQDGVFGNIIFKPTVLYCRLLSVILNISGIFSSWLIVLVAIERTISVFYPFKVHIYCSKKRTLFILGFLFIIAIAGSLPYFFGPMVLLRDGMHLCTVSGPDHIYNLAMFISTSLLYSIIPFIIVTSLNIALAKKIYKQNTIQSTRQDNNSALVATLFAISTLFVLTTLPSSIILILSEIWQIAEAKMHVPPIYMNMTFTLECVNHSVNFFLYCLTGSSFRKALQKLFGFGQRHHQGRQNRQQEIWTISEE